MRSPSHPAAGRPWCHSATEGRLAGRRFRALPWGDMFERLRDDDGQIPFIRDLGRGRDDDTLRSAEASYLRYLTLLWTIAAEAAEAEADNTACSATETDTSPVATPPVSPAGAPSSGVTAAGDVTATADDGGDHTPQAPRLGRPDSTRPGDDPAV